MVDVTILSLLERSGDSEATSSCRNAISNTCSLPIPEALKATAFAASFAQRDDKERHQFDEQHTYRANRDLGLYSANRLS